MALQQPNKAQGREALKAHGFDPQDTLPPGPLGVFLLHLMGVHGVLIASAVPGERLSQAVAGLVETGKLLKEASAGGLQ